MNSKRILLREYGITPENKDNTYALRKLLDTYRRESGLILVLEQGIYQFHPDYAEEHLLYISNHHEDVPKRVIFNLSQYDQLTVEGNGAMLLFYMDCIPFYVDHANHILLQDLSIDYARPAYSEGTVLSTSASTVTVHIDHRRYPFQVAHGRLYFAKDPESHQYDMELWGWLEFNRQRQAPEEDILDVYMNKGSGETTETDIICTKIEEDMVLFKRTEGEFIPRCKIDNTLVLRHHKRTDPGIYVTNSESIQMIRVNCYHTLGIAFMAEHTKDIMLKQFCVIRNPWNPRIFTASADATHFVYCGGKIELSQCVFENQLDDAVNIHGIYAKVEKVLSDRGFIIRLVHDMHRGVPMAQCGDKVRFLESDTLLEKGELQVDTWYRLNSEYQFIKTTDVIEGLKEGMAIENLNWIPKVHIHDCIFRNNRARGLLLTCADNTLIEYNLFQNAGAAILMEGDASGWYESGATTNITISNNIFDHCAYVSDWGHAPIQATPSVIEEEGHPYHRRIQITDNEFKVFDERILYMKHVGQLIFLRNTVCKSKQFLAKPGKWAECYDVASFEEDDK
ncbi:MAG: right-handed parallel beta-helix repeat-containing protein [Lachnospiraceae bacterium]